MVLDVEQIELTSVGLDVGSSTSHLVFSELILKRDELSSSRRFVVVSRKIIYEGQIIDTPLVDRRTIDIEKLTNFFKEEYIKAGIQPENVDTGAVIVTGETAKKENASQIIESLSSDSGKFVSATAGPNFESMLAAMGSGITERSKIMKNTILSVDIGGGTSNMAISKDGQVISTACISVGGRLVAFDNNQKIIRIDEPAKLVIDHLGYNLKIGDLASNEQISAISSKFADILLEVCSGLTKTELAKKLMMTTDLDFSAKIDEISFSGGVAELIFKSNGYHYYNDIGQNLADEIVKRKDNFIAPIIEPEYKIRATVIGAGAYSLSISGSTSFADEDDIEFPVRNIPVIRVNIDRMQLSEEHVITEINKSFERFDIKEGTEIIALFFVDPVRASYAQLKLFASGLEKALPNSLLKKIPIILIFQRDIGNSVGNVIRRETQIKEQLMCLDELNLEEGDWIDIGSPLVNGQVFPVTVKSLVFNKNIDDNYLNKNI